MYQPKPAGEVLDDFLYDCISYYHSVMIDKRAHETSNLQDAISAIKEQFYLLSTWFEGISIFAQTHFSGALRTYFLDFKFVEFTCSIQINFSVQVKDKPLRPPSSEIVHWIRNIYFSFSYLMTVIGQPRGCKVDFLTDLSESQQTFWNLVSQISSGMEEILDAPEF